MSVWSLLYGDPRKSHWRDFYLEKVSAEILTKASDERREATAGFRVRIIKGEMRTAATLNVAAMHRLY